MAMRTTPPFLDDAQLRIEAEQRRAAYHARLERDQRLRAGLAGLALVIGSCLGMAVVRLFGG